MASIRNQSQSGQSVSRGKGAGRGRSAAQKLAQAASQDAVVGAGSPVAEPAPAAAAKPGRNVVKVDLGRSAVKQVKVVDTDLVLLLEDGSTVYVRDGAVQAMIDPDFAVQFSDGTETRGQDLLHSADAAAVGNSVIAGTTADGQPGPVVTDATPPVAVATAPAPRTPKWQNYALIGAPLIGGGLAGVLGGKSSASAATTTQSSGGTTTLATKTAIPVILPVNGNNVINKAAKDAGVTVKGTSEGGATVTVLFGGVQKTATADASGNWSVTYAATEVPADAAQVGISATAKSATASASDPASRDVAIDTTPPAAPGLDKVTGDDVLSPSEQQAPVTLSGTTDAGATVKVQWGTTTKAVVADAAGVWKATFAVGEFPTAPGQYTVTATATDAAGNTGTPGTRAVTINPAVDVAGQVAAGQVLSGNGLVITILSADGKTVLASNIKIAPNGSFTATGLNVGTGEAIIAVVTDTNDAPDYIDEATGLSKNLGSARLLATGLVNGGTVTLNVNPLTTIAAQQAGVNADGSGSVTAAKVTAANLQVAQAVGLGAVDITQLAPVLTNGGNFNAQDGISKAEQAGALLAALSGLDAINNGNVQQTIATLSSQISNGKLSAQGQALILNGAVKAASNDPTLAPLQKVVSDTVTQASTTTQFTIGTVAGDNIIAASEVAGLKITGTVAADAKSVTLQLGSKSVTADIKGTDWSYAVTADDLAALGANGVKLLSASATLADGSSVSASRPIGLYTTRPTAPTFDLVAGDNKINAEEARKGLTLTGTGVPGTTVTVHWDSGTPDKTAVVASNGTWSVLYQPSEVPSSPTNKVTVTLTDQFGNVSDPAVNSVIYDVDPPAMPGVDPVNGNNTVGIGATTSGVLLTGTGERGANVSFTWGKLSVSGIIVDATNGTWKYLVLPGSLPDNGTQVLRVTQTDSAGNVSEAKSLLVNVSATPPLPPTITSVSGDNYVNKAEATGTVLVRGKGTQGQSVYVKFGTFTAKSSTVNALGDWTAVFSASLTSAGIPSEGTYTVSAYAVDADGNVSSTYNFPTPVVVDTTIGVPTVGDVAGDNIVSATELNDGIALTGRADSDVVKVEVTLTNGITTIVAAGLPNGAAGSWSAIVPKSELLTDGRNWTATVTTTDRAGNAATSAPRTFEIDTTPPSPPTITTQGGTLTLTNAALQNGFVLTGTGEPNARVVLELKRDGLSIFTTPKDASAIKVGVNGVWTYTLQPGDIPGVADYQLSAYAIDVAGNQGASSAAVTAQIRTSLPPAPTIEFVSGNNLIGIDEAKGTIEVKGKLTGITNAADWVGRTVEVAGPYGTATGTVQADLSWKATLPAKADGLTGVTTYAVTARLVDDFGNRSLAAAGSATVDLIAPTPAIVGQIAGDGTLNATEKNGKVVVSGTTDTDTASLQFSIGGVAASKIERPTTGTWTATFDAGTLSGVTPVNGKLAVSLTATDNAGNVTTVPSTINADFTAPTPVITSKIAGDDIINFNERRDGFTVSGTIDSDAQALNVSIGGITQAAVLGTISGSIRSWSVTFPAGSLDNMLITGGTTAVVLSGRDVANNTFTVTSSIGADVIAPTAQVTNAPALTNGINKAESASGFTISGTTSVDTTNLQVTLGGVGATVTFGDPAQGATTRTWTAVFGSLTNMTLDSNNNTSLVLTASDAAGNSSTQTSSYAVDVTPPTVTIDTGKIAGDDAINIAERDQGVTVTGTTSADTKSLTIAIGAQSVNATLGTIQAGATTRTWTATFTKAQLEALTGTSAQATITATDTADNVTTVSKALTIDYVAPNAFVVSNPATITLGTAALANGYTFSGTGTQGDTVEIVWKNGTQEVARNPDVIRIGPGGTWTYNFPGNQFPTGGLYTVELLERDPNGNPSTTTQLSLDLKTATVPSVEAGSIKVSGDNLLNANEAGAAIVVTGKAPQSANNLTVEVTLADANGVRTTRTAKGQVTQNATTGEYVWTVTLPAPSQPLVAGSYKVIAQVLDAANNRSNEVSADITVDTGINVLQINGAIAGDGVINAQEATSAGFMASGIVDSDVTLVEVTIGGVKVIASLDPVSPGSATRRWTANFAGLPNPTESSTQGNLPFGQKSYDVVVKATDAAGNDRQITSTVAGDFIAPDAPGIDPNQLYINKSARDGTITITGTAERGATINVLLDGKAPDSPVVAGVDGKWSATFSGANKPADPPGGSAIVNLTVTATDAAGNVSQPTSQQITVDTKVGTPIIDGLFDSQNNPVSALNNTLKTTAYTIKGKWTYEPGAALTVTVGKLTLTNVQANSDGTWTATIPAGSQGNFTGTTTQITVTVTDAARNVASSTPLTVLTDFTAPTITLDPVTSDNKLNQAERDGELTLTGTTAADAESLLITVGGVSRSATLLAVDPGATTRRWTATFGAGSLTNIPLVNGQVTITLVAKDVAGNSTTVAPKITAGFTPPIAPTVDSVSVDNAISLSERTGTVTVTGTAAPNSTVAFVWGAFTKPDVTVNADGRWSVDLLPSQLPGATGDIATITVTASDALGNQSVGTKNVVMEAFSFDPVAGDNVISGAEKTTSLLITGKYVIKPDNFRVVLHLVSDGANVNNDITLTNASFATDTKTWSVTLTDAQLAQLGDGAFTLTAYGTIGGRASSSVVPISIVTQAAKPSVTSAAHSGVISAFDVANGFDVTVRGKQGDTVTVRLLQKNASGTDTLIASSTLSNTLSDSNPIAVRLSSVGLGVLDPTKSYYLVVVARDALNNQSPSDPFNVSVNLSAPKLVSIGTGAVAGTYAEGATIAIVATMDQPVKAGSTFRVTFNSGGTATLTAQSDGTTLTGTYTIGKGEATATGALLSVKGVDLVSVTSVLDVAPANLFDPATVTQAFVNVRVDAIANQVLETVQLLLAPSTQAGPAVSDASGKTVNGTTDGWLRFRVPIPTGAVFEAGETIQIVRVVNGVSTGQVVASYTVPASALDNGKWKASVPSLTLSASQPLAAGSYTFAVVVKDIYGNLSVVNSSTKTLTVNIDNTAPVIDLNGAAAGVDNQVLTSSGTATALVDPSATVLDALGTETPAGGSNISEIRISADTLGIGALKDLLSVNGATNLRVGTTVASGWNADGSSGSTITFTLSGVNWTVTYRADTKTFSFTPGGTVTTAQAKDLLAALRFTDPNTAASPADGIRQFTIRVVDGAGNVSSPATSTVVVNGARPTAAATAPIVGFDTNNDGVRDSFVVTLSEAVQVAAATSLANWSGTAAAALGTGATITAVNSFTLNGVTYASQFRVAAGAGASLVAGQTLSLAAAAAIGTGGAGDVAAAAVNFVMPKLNPPANNAAEYFATVTLVRSPAGPNEVTGQPNSFLSASELDKATPQAIILRESEGVGFWYINGVQVGSRTRLATDSGTFSIANWSVSSWGQDGIKQFAARLQDPAGYFTTWTNLRKVQLDTVLQGIAQVSVVTNLGSPGADANDVVRIDFREPVLLSADNLPAAFGQGATVTAITPFTTLTGGYDLATLVSPSSAYASSYLVKLGSNPTLGNGQTLTFSGGATPIADLAGNTAPSITFTTATDLFDRPGTPVIGNVTSDNVINTTENGVAQTVAIRLSGAKVGDVVTLYRDGVKIGDSVSLTAAQVSAGSVNMSVAAFAWGADGEHALTATVRRGDTGTEVSSAVRSVYVAAQNAHWSAVLPNTVWFDPDTLTQGDGATVTSWTASAGRTSTGAALVATTSGAGALLSRDSAGHVQLLFNASGAFVTAGMAALPTLAGGFANYSQARPLGAVGTVLASYVRSTDAAGTNQTVTIGVRGDPTNTNLFFYQNLANFAGLNLLGNGNPQNPFYIDNISAPLSMNLWRTVAVWGNGSTVFGAVDDGPANSRPNSSYKEGTSNISTITIGSDTFQGMVADQILFTTAITTAMNDEVSTYLAVKYQAIGTPAPVTASGQTYDLTKNAPVPGVVPIIVDDILQLGQTTLGTGNDTVITAGPDFVNAGAGNDTVRTTDLQFRVLDGSIGFDTFALDNSYRNSVSGSVFNLSDYVSNARGMGGNSADNDRVNANGFHKLQGFERLDFTRATESQTVKLTLADIDQLVERDSNSVYSLYLKLGANDVLDRSALGGAKYEYGLWSDGSGDGTLYNQRLVGTVGTDNVALYLSRSAKQLGPDIAAQVDSVGRSATAVTIQLDQSGIIAGPGAATGQDWSGTFGTIAGASISSSGGGSLLTISGTGLGGAATLELTYAGTGLTNANGDQLRWTRFAIGTDANNTIDLSTRTGNGFAIFGLGGNDTITGTARSDLIIGGFGNDTMTGGLGADVFRMVKGDTGLDTITDFSVAQGDQIDLRALLAGVPLNLTTDSSGNVTGISNLKLTALNSTDLVLWADTGGSGIFDAATTPYGVVLSGGNTTAAAVGSDATFGGLSLLQLINSQAVLVG